jgi:site-specific DNA-methyltransferase (adenine-specific)
MNLYNCGNLEFLKSQPDNSIDSIVTDPPYGISFMGKSWDYDVPGVDTWKELMRVLKPGGHIIVACGTRTQHRMAVNIEDAGFEIRDIVAWVYGSGFPKSLNIGKAVDKLQGNERKSLGIRDTKVGMTDLTNFTTKNRFIEETKGNSPYEGWGTALKPAMELWTLARKPLSEKTVAENVLKWGTGGINIDECRVGDETRTYDLTMTSGNFETTNGGKNVKSGTATVTGRFPANFIHDGSDEVVDMFPNDTQRFFYTAKASKSERNAGLDGFEEKERVNYGGFHSEKGLIENNRNPDNRLPNKNHHPTVKPVALMRYLARLITPKGGVVLDPYMGSGSTGVACMQEGFNFIGVEMDKEYFEIAKARIEHWKGTDL